MKVNKSCFSVRLHSQDRNNCWVCQSTRYIFVVLRSSCIDLKRIIRNAIKIVRTSAIKIVRTNTIKIVRTSAITESLIETKQNRKGNANRESYNKCCTIFDKFHENSRKSLVPIKSEVVVGDKEFGVCGMLDQLFWNEKAQEYQIWDWKTNKEINKFSNPILIGD